MIKNIDLAYWAGVVDSDGSICLSKTYSKRVDGTKRTYHFIRCMIYSNTKSVCERALNCFKLGTIQTSRPRTRDRNGKITQDKVMYAWTTTTKDTEKVLKLMIPYLRLKKPQAELALKFRLEKQTNFKGRDKDGNYITLPIEELDKREQMYKQMKMLNHRNKI